MLWSGPLRAKRKGYQTKSAWPPLSCLPRRAPLEPKRERGPFLSTRISRDVRPEEDQLSDELNRRNFIENSGRLAASTAGIATWSALHPAVRTARGEAVAPSETIRVAIIGSSDQNWPHVQDFVKCVKSRAGCISDVETGHTSTAVCHLGNISYKLGRKIFWDAPSETIVDQKGHPDAEANALLGREYRKGYELPKVEPA